MPKFFRFIFISACLHAAVAASDNNALCVIAEKEPVLMQESLQETGHPDSAVYHESMAKAVAQANATLDWIQDPAADSTCGGYYLTPDNPNPQAEIKPDYADLVISATTAEKNLDGFTSLTGSVEVYQGTRRFRCDTMRFSEEQEFSELTGNIQFREPGLLLLADSATMDRKNHFSTFTGTEYILHGQQAHGRAGYINITDVSGTYLTLRDTSFTLCPPSAEFWSFDARRLEIDNEKGWGKLYSAFFKLNEIPVFYVPYLDFPIDDRRKTGLLWPSLASADNNGIDITLPYYFNLAPHFDLTYVPRYNGDHGFLHGVEARYKHKYSEWSLGGTYIGNDEMVGDIEVSDDPGLDQRRWLAFIQESGRFNANWSTRVDYQSVSDINYFRDWGTTGLDVRKSTNIKRQAMVKFVDDNWATSATVVDYQTLEYDKTTNEIAMEEYSQLPALNFRYRNLQRPFYLETLLLGQATFFDHEERIRSQRVYLEPGLAYPMRWTAAEMIPAIKIRHTHFRLNDSNDADEVAQPDTVYRGQKDIDVPSFTLDNRLFLERELDVGSQPFMQTLTPRLFYYYADFEDQSSLPAFDTAETAFSYQQLFRDNRFGSYDRIADANQFSWALESEIFNRDSGRKLASFGIGQTHYFRERNVTVNATDRDLLVIDGSESRAELQQKEDTNQDIDRLYYRNASDIAMEASWHIDPDQRLSGSVIFDPYNEKNQESSVGYHYQDKNQGLLNISYRFKRLPSSVTDSGDSFNNDINQTDLSFYQPVNNNWHLFMRWNYDIRNNETIEDISGFRYEGCCFGVMVAYQRERKTFENNLRIDDTADADYRYGWLIQFELKGLGGVTNSITTLIEESIQGYKKRETDI